MKSGQCIYIHNIFSLSEALPKNLTPFVLINPRTENPYSKNINRNIWNPACKKALGCIFPLNNTTRHSFANELVLMGADLKIVELLLRHRDSRVTEQHYATPSLDAAKRVFDKVKKHKK